MDLSIIIETGKCCACEAPLSFSRSLNMAVLNLKPTWKFPVIGNVLTQEEDRAVGFVCDRCQEAGMSDQPPVVKFAMEFNEDKIIYHPVEPMSENKNSEMDIKASNTLFQDSPEAGKNCLCSRCLKPIKHVALRCWPDSGGEYRFHFKCQGYDESYDHPDPLYYDFSKHPEQ